MHIALLHLPYRLWLILCVKISSLMHGHYLVGVKLLETFFRGLYVLGVTYCLPLEEAGKFGLLVTIIGFLSFGLGFERYIDVQRQVAGRSVSAIRLRMVETQKFFLLHYIIVILPIISLAIAIGVPGEYIVLVVLIVVGEHLSNQAYLSTLLVPDTFPLLLASVVKNLIQIVVLLRLSLNASDKLTVLTFLHFWAIVSFGYIAAATIWWSRWAQKGISLEGDELPKQSFCEQYRASIFHFIVGLVAVAALQVDRFIIGSMLIAPEIGIYFRNIVLVGLALQIFSIMSYNRISPSVYRYAREGSWCRGAGLVKREYFRVVLCFTVFVAMMLVVDSVLGYPSRRWGLQRLFVMIMSAGVLFRIAADYSGVLLLSLGYDKMLFRNQAAAVILGAGALLALSSAYQLTGAFIGGMLTPFFYYLFNRLSIRIIFRRLEANLK